MEGSLQNEESELKKMKPGNLRNKERQTSWRRRQLLKKKRRRSLKSSPKGKQEAIMCCKTREKRGGRGSNNMDNLKF